MSGDVQPRKRKDKRRKKEGESLGNIHDVAESKDEPEEVPVHTPSHAASYKGENIHVHHDHEIGGNLCVKIIFFALLAVLLGMVGLIFIESRGSTDVDLPSIEDSRFAEYFTGWLDDSQDDHGHDDHAVGSEEGDDDHDDHDDDEHDNGPSDEAGHSEEEDEGHSEQEESEPAATEETEDDDRSERKAVDEESEEKDEPDDEDENTDEDESEDEEDEDEENTNEVNDEDEEEEENTNEVNDDDGNEDNTNEVNDDDEDNTNEVNDDDEDEENSNEESENDSDEVEDEDYDLTQEDASEEQKSVPPPRKYSKQTEEKTEEVDSGVEVESDEDDNDDDDNDENESEEQDDIEPTPDSEEQVEEIEESEEALKEEEEAVKKEKFSLLDEDIEDISDIKLRKKKEKELMRKLEKLLKEQEKTEETEAEDEDREEREETSGVALKLGVGVALVVVAHLVIVRRWRQLTHANEVMPGDGEEQVIDVVNEPVVSRRQTLVPEAVDIPADGMEEDDADELSEEEVIEVPVKRRTSMDVKLERQDPEKYYTKEELGDSEDLDDEEELGEEEEYLEEEEELEEEEDEDYELEASPPPSDLGEPEEEEELEEEEEELVPQPPRPVVPPRRGPQGVEENIESNNELKEEPQELDDTDSLEANKDSAEPKTTDEDDDWFFRQELEFADAHFQNKPQLALDTYDKILNKSAKFVRALIGRARVLDHIADVQKSNVVLGQAIEAYFTLVTEDGALLDDDTFRDVAERCVNRMRFAGRNVNAAVVQQALINRFPDEVQHRNAMAVSYLLGGRAKLAQKVLEETLNRWPDDGYAQVHLGFVLKTSMGMLEKGAELMEKGIRSNQSGTMDGRFLFHLGDALHRIGRGDEALDWYELGVKNKIFKSKYQRSLYNVDRLKAKPWWSVESTGYLEFFKNLEKHWEKIREEGMALLQARDKALFQDEAESLKDTGDWKQLDLFTRGRKQTGCTRAPFTCQLIGAYPPAATCSRGQAKFSVMEPGTHVWPHCGPTNCRLRAHLGLVVPDGVYLRVAKKTKSWRNGKIFVFDDSFEHEVWHNGTSVRLVLIIDVWHPELTPKERQTLTPI